MLLTLVPEEAGSRNAPYLYVGEAHSTQQLKIEPKKTLVGTYQKKNEVMECETTYPCRERSACERFEDSTRLMLERKAHEDRQVNSNRRNRYPAGRTKRRKLRRR